VSYLNIDDLNILVVEPSSTQLKIIINHLKESGVKQVEGKTDCTSALEYMQTYTPDLVISAMYFRDMTATELVQQMRQDDKLKAIPFMLVSSETRFKILDPIRQSGIIGILPKPFERQDLKRALNATLDVLSPEELELETYDIDSVKALVVDDSLTSRNHVKRMLNDMGMQHIHQAENGKAAIALLEEQVFDIIVTDYNMPEMDGCQLVDFVRNFTEQSYIPILMVTSEEDSTRIASVQQAGVSAILDKPFEPADMRKLIVRLLSGED